MDKKILIIFIAGLILVGGAAVFIFTREKSQSTEYLPLVLPPIEREEAGFGGQVYEQVQAPAEKLPEANPFEAQTNPFEAKTNPFEGGYTNPFE